MEHHNIVRLAIFLLLENVVGQWRGEIELISNEVGMYTITDIFIPKENPEYTHILLQYYIEKQKESNIHYIIFHTQTRKIAKQESKGNNLLNGKITGSKDGKKLFMTYLEKKSASVNDLYFTESSDSGFTWTSPVKIGPLDKFSRSHQTILYSDTMDRVWVFYFRYDLSSKKQWIEMVTRPKSSSIFSKEQKIQNIGANSLNLNAAITIKNEYSWILHIKYSDDCKEGDFCTYYSYSENNGLIWSSPVLMDEKIQFFSTSMVSHFSSLNPVLVSSASNIEKTTFKISKNEGRNWEDRGSIKHSFFWHSASICEGRTPSDIYYFFLGSGFRPHFYYYDPIVSEQIIEGPLPFKNSGSSWEPTSLSHISFLSCYRKDASTIIITAITVKSDIQKNKLLEDEFVFTHSQSHYLWCWIIYSTKSFNNFYSLFYQYFL